MGNAKGSYPSDDFLQTPPIESFDEMRSQIEALFKIKIEPNFTMNANIKICER